MDPHPYPTGEDPGAFTPYDDQDSGASQSDALLFVALAASFSGGLVGFGLGLTAYPCLSRFVAWMLA